MVKLDVSIFGFLEPKFFRVLIAVEMGMKNHQVVPIELIATLAGLMNGGCYKIIKELSKNKLVAFEKSRTIAEGYRLTTQGYDFLALKALCNSGKISSFGVKIGVGKESDVFTVMDSDGKIMIVKFHRLGRTCFRQIKNKREYHQHRTAASWLYLSRISATNEFRFQQELYNCGFPVPEPIAHNRHAVLMQYIENSRLLQDYSSLPNVDDTFDICLGLAVRLAEYGLIHCDLNEFNLLLDDQGKIWLIDFPQMISRNHKDAKMFFDRDINSLTTFFSRRFNVTLVADPVLSEIKREHAFDRKIKAAGFAESDEGVDILADEAAIEAGLESLCLSDEESVITTQSTTSAHPNPDYVKRRVRSEKILQEKKQNVKRAIKRGEASAVNRRKRFNNELNGEWFIN